MSRRARWLRSLIFFPATMVVEMSITEASPLLFQAVTSGRTEPDGQPYGIEAGHGCINDFRGALA